MLELEDGEPVAFEFRCPLHLTAAPSVPAMECRAKTLAEVMANTDRPGEMLACVINHDREAVAFKLDIPSVTIEILAQVPPIAKEDYVTAIAAYAEGG